MIRHALKAAGAWLAGLFTKNKGMKIGSLVFAFLLWAYVTTTTNPLRAKTLTDVPVTYVGADDMRSRGLTPAVPFYDVLNTVTVSVEVPTQNVSAVTRSSVTASVDLTGITEPGEYTLPVMASTEADFISITSTMPANATVQIEESVQKQVPIEVQLEGVRDPYRYYGVPKLSQSTITLSGPRSGIEQVARAVCTVDVSGLTETTTATHSLTLVDQSGEEIPSNLFAGVPSVIVEVPIYPVRNVSLNAERIKSLISGVPDGYEISDIVIEPGSVEIAGPSEAIRAVQTVSVEPLDVEGETGTVTFENVKLLLPDAIYTAVPDEVQITVTMDEIQSEKQYEGVEVAVKNLPADLEAALEPAAVEVTLSGRANALNQIHLSEIHPFVDLAGLVSGTYEAEIKFDNEADLGADITAEPARITVTVSPRREP